MNDCLQCGNKTRNAKYCSIPCSAASRRKGQEILCVYCKKPFYAKRRKLKQGRPYCSIKCQVSSTNQLARKICQNKDCRKFFMVRQAEYHSRKYCSTECYIETCRKPPQKQKCLHCGDEFTVRHRKKRKYCSVACARKSQRKLTVCRHCMKSFWSKHKGRVFCCPRCRESHKRQSYGNCAWCGEKRTSRGQESFCSTSCAVMSKHYGDVNIQRLDIPKVMVYPNDEAAGIWLPVSAAEIEIIAYLHHQGMSVVDMVPHIKRWRRVRQANRKGTKARKGSRF